jgi:predicted alpha/beta superfamily hydrolase
MKTAQLIFVIFCFTFSYAQAQKSGVVNPVGKNYFIQSDALDEEREIQIYLPDSYENKDKKYPVLFLLDGQRFFLYGVSLLQSFTQFQLTPEFIVVGIKNKYPQRFSHFSSGNGTFLGFFEKDVLGFVDNNFRTSGERLLFGWEYAGSFVIQSMIDKPELFDAYMAASPYPIKEKIKAIDRLIHNESELKGQLYFTVSLNEGMVEEGTDSLNTVLGNKPLKMMNWTYRKLEGEAHRSTPYATIYHGLRTYYNYYPELQFNTLEEFTKAGGMAYVNDYYKQRANAFGFSPEIPNWTKFTIIRNAMGANDYDQFDHFTTKFKTAEFIGQLRGNRPYAIAEFYLKHQEYEKAIDIFKILVSQYPESERPLNSLGDVYTSLKDEKKASEYYQLAAELIEKNAN